MEKSSRARDGSRVRRLLTTFLCRLFLLFCALSPLHSLDAEVHVSAFELTEGQTVTVEVQVYGSEPAETTLAFDFIPESFTAESGRKEVRLDSRTANAVVTVFTREWTVSSAGNFTLGPIIVGSATGTPQAVSITLPPVYITVLLPPEKEIAALRWMIERNGILVVPESASALRSGETCHLVLEGYFSGTAGPIDCPAPEDALLEAVSVFSTPDGSPVILNGDVSGWQRLASWNWTPLGEGSHRLPTAAMELAGKRTIVSFPVILRVEQATGTKAATADSTTLRSAFSPAPGTSSSVKADTSPDALRSSKADSVPGNSLQLRLAALRRSEYRSLFPGKARADRLSLESESAISQTFSVPSGGWKHPAVIGAVLLFCLVFLLRLLPGWAGRSRFIPLVCAVSGIVLSVYAISLYVQDSKPAGVSCASPLFMVPETDANTVALLDNGSALRILRKAGTWYYAETFSTIRGWIPADRVIEYTNAEK